MGMAGYELLEHMNHNSYVYDEVVRPKLNAQNVKTKGDNSKITN